MQTVMIGESHLGVEGTMMPKMILIKTHSGKDSWYQYIKATTRCPPSQLPTHVISL